MDADQSALNPIGSAVGWLQGALLGSIATTAAVLAVASIGYLMLTGRIDVRRAGGLRLLHPVWRFLNRSGDRWRSQWLPSGTGGRALARLRCPASLLPCEVQPAVRSLRRRRRPHTGISAVAGPAIRARVVERGH